MVKTTDGFLFLTKNQHLRFLEPFKTVKPLVSFIMKETRQK